MSREKPVELYIDESGSLQRGGKTTGLRISLRFGTLSGCCCSGVSIRTAAVLELPKSITKSTLNGSPRSRGQTISRGRKKKFFSFQGNSSFKFSRLRGSWLK